MLIAEETGLCGSELLAKRMTWTHVADVVGVLRHDIRAAGCPPARPASLLWPAATWAMDDGARPLRMREVRTLRGRDRRQRIRFVDTAADGLDEASPGGTREMLMDRTHGRLPDGAPVEGVEAFRHLCAAVGLGPLVALTRLPDAARLPDRACRAFAQRRLRLTGPHVDGACEPHSEPRAFPANRWCA